MKNCRYIKHITFTSLKIIKNFNGTILNIKISFSQVLIISVCAYIVLFRETSIDIKQIIIIESI